MKAIMKYIQQPHRGKYGIERDAADKRLTKAINILATIAAFCFIGVLLAWRG